MPRRLLAADAPTGEQLPLLLVLAYFPAFSPPMSGGEMRLLHLYRAVSADYRGVLLTSTNFGARYEEVDHAPTMREMRFPKDAAWHRAYRTLAEAGATGDLSGMAFALTAADPTCPLRIKAIEIAATAAVVIHEFPYSEGMFRERPPRREVYNAHNFELGLLPHGAGRAS